MDLNLNTDEQQLAASLKEVLQQVALTNEGIMNNHMEADKHTKFIDTPSPSDKSVFNSMANFLEKDKVEVLKEKQEYNSMVNERFDFKYYKKFKDFNIAMEGNKNTPYVPGKRGAYGNSGVTVGQGLDLGQLTPAKAKQFGMSNELINTFNNYGAFGKQGEAAAKVARKMKKDGFVVGDEDMELLNRGTFNQYKENIQKYRNAYPNLSDRGVVMLTQLDHWTGGIQNRNDKASKLNRFDDFKFRGTGKTSNPLADALENSPNIADTDLSNIMGEYRDGLPTGYKLNRRTFNRYKNYLDRGDPDIDA